MKLAGWLAGNMCVDAGGETQSQHLASNIHTHKPTYMAESKVGKEAAAVGTQTCSWWRLVVHTQSDRIWWSGGSGNKQT